MELNDITYPNKKSHGGHTLMRWGLSSPKETVQLLYSRMYYLCNVMSSKRNICKECGISFNSQKELDQYIRQEHPSPIT